MPEERANRGPFRAFFEASSVTKFTIAATASTVLASLIAIGGPAASATRTPDRACVAGQPSITVTVSGFKTDSGMVRAQLYGPNPGDFLGKGKWVMRIEERRASAGPMRFCFPVERPGRYAVAVRHDANGNSKSDWNDGGGFTGNPRVSLTSLRPTFNAAAVAVQSTPVTASITMQYRQGLSIRPLR